MKFFATLGMGGSLAGFIYYYQRKDSIRHAEEWRGQAALLMGIVASNTTAVVKCVEAISANTHAIDELRGELQQRRYRTRDSD